MFVSMMTVTEYTFEVNAVPAGVLGDSVRKCASRGALLIIAIPNPETYDSAVRLYNFS